MLAMEQVTPSRLFSLVRKILKVLWMPSIYRQDERQGRFLYVDKLIFKMELLEVARRILPSGRYFLYKFLRAYFISFIETVTVKVEQGLLRGQKCTSALGQSYYSFQGVPYAKPPVRFKDPELPEPWLGVRDALKEGHACAHADLATGIFVGSEDCLYLNIYTPKAVKDESGRAVLVWIHPGGFSGLYAHACVFGPDFLLREDVVLVTLNFRIGALGFLSTGTNDAPGNAGLKDVVMALEWIQRNISEFGGDPNRVTLFGSSSGAAAVELVMLSPKTKGLIHRGISQSGTGTCSWAFDKEPVATAQRLGEALGCRSQNPKTIFEFLSRVPVEKLVKTQGRALSDERKRTCIPIPFVPCAEPKTYPNAFLVQDPTEMLSNGDFQNDIPYMIGNNIHEGHVALSAIMIRKGLMEEVDQDPQRFVPLFLNFERSEDLKAAGEKIKRHYFGDKSFNRRTFAEFMNMSTDSCFLHGTYKSTILRVRSGKSPVYNFRFTFDGNFGFAKILMKHLCDAPGSVHGDEMGYLFHIPIAGQNLDPKSSEMKVSQKIVKLWCNFAKYGNPTPDADPALDNVTWEPVSRDKMSYLDIGERLELRENMLRQDSLQLWSDLGYSFAIPNVRY